MWSSSATAPEGYYLANKRTGKGSGSDAGGLFPATFGPGDNARGRMAPRPKQGPSYFDQAFQGIMALPPEAFGSLNNFGASGGFNALLAPLMQGNPLGMLALKFLPGLFDKGPKLPVQKAVPVAIVEVKDTAMDIFTLTNTRSAFSDTYGRRQRLASPAAYSRAR